MKNNQMPVKGGVKRRKGAIPKMNQSGADAGTVVYNTIGSSCITKLTLGVAAGSRLYAPGYAADLIGLAPGPRIVNNYSTGKFLPGTSIKWEPSVSFTTSGRGYVAFTDNPEVMKDIRDRLSTFNTTPTIANYENFAVIVKNLGNVVSFPVWQETSIQVPTRLRRKRFDCNGSVEIDTDVLDRSAQVAMFWAFDGVINTENYYLGSFHYHDKVQVEGITVSVT